MKSRAFVILPLLSFLMASTMVDVQPAHAAASAACELKIGAMGPLSGPATQWGAAMVGAAELAAAEANHAGGLQIGSERCHVSVETYDSRYSGEAAAAGMNKFVSDNVKFVIGPVGSPEVTGMKPIAARNDVLVMADSFAKNAIGPQWPLVFHLGPGPSEWAAPIIAVAKKKFAISSAVVVAPNDQGGTDIAPVDASSYEANGIKSHIEYYQRGTTDFAAVVTRILSAHPDAVDTASSPPGDTGVMVKELRQAGYKGAIGHLGGPGTAEIARIAGGTSVLGNFYWYEVVPNNARVHALDAEYTQLMHAAAPQNSFFYLWTAGARMMLKAISKAGTATDTAKVAEALRNMPVDDPNLGKGHWSGKSFFGVNQEISLPFGIGVYANGKFEGITELSSATP